MALRKVFNSNDVNDIAELFFLLIGKSLKAKNFDEFQQNTHDAWEFSNDDLMALNWGSVLQQDVATTTANNVIENHKKSNKSPPNQNGSKLPQAKNGNSSQPSQFSDVSDIPSSLPRPNSRERDKNERAAIKVKKFDDVLKEDPIDLDRLRDLCWNGIPLKLRPYAWRLLNGYLPPNKDRQTETLERKRRDYFQLVESIFNNTTTFNHEVHRWLHFKFDLKLLILSVRLYVGRVLVASLINLRWFFVWFFVDVIVNL